jgi:hypothetical protein
MLVRALMVPLGIALTLGCKSSSTRAAAASSPADVPVITRVSPDSGPAGTAYPIEVTIEGHGFADSLNVVTFGPATVTDVPSSKNGTRIVLYLPKEAASSSEVPPSPLFPGTYELHVKTSAGTSNAVTFRLTGSAP